VADADEALRVLIAAGATPSGDVQDVGDGIRTATVLDPAAPRSGSSKILTSRYPTPHHHALLAPGADHPYRIDDPALPAPPAAIAWW